MILAQGEVGLFALFMSEEAAEAVRAVAFFELLAFLGFVILVFHLFVEQLVRAVGKAALRPIPARAEFLPILAQLRLVARVDHRLVPLVLIQRRLEVLIARGLGRGYRDTPSRLKGCHEGVARILDIFHFLRRVDRLVRLHLQPR